LHIKELQFDYKTKNTSPRLFTINVNTTTKPRPPPRVCLPNLQIRKQTRAKINKRGLSESTT